VRFPESVDVAAAVSLAGVGLDRTELVVNRRSVPRTQSSRGRGRGAIRSLRFEIANVATEENPRTGRLVAMSLVRALLDGTASFTVG
jgi:aspartate dehydrogenase